MLSNSRLENDIPEGGGRGGTFLREGEGRDLPEGGRGGREARGRRREGGE